MCRWLAYSGAPVLLEDLVYEPPNSLVVQSLHSRLGAETTIGDGFGVGWYGDRETPGVFRSTEPAWNDRNLQELAGQISSRMVLAHIRASALTHGLEDDPPAAMARAVTSRRSAGVGVSATPSRPLGD